MEQLLITRSVVIPPLCAPETRRVSNQEVRVTPAPMTLLSSGVPLSLLMDLVLGPCSEDLLSQEGLPTPRESQE